MKKLLISIMSVAVVVGIGVYATNAYFSDTEKSVGNTFAAGSLDLKVDSECHYDGMVCKPPAHAVPVGPKFVWQLETPNGVSTNPDLLGQACTCTWGSTDLTNQAYFNFTDVKPGDVGENTISLTAKTNDAWLCAYVKSLTSADNSCTGPEAKAEMFGNALACDPNGNLQNALNIKIWKDANCDNVAKGSCLALNGESDDNDIDECATQTVNGEAACNVWTDNAGETPECHWVADSSEPVLFSGPIDSHNGVWPLDQLKGDVKTCLGAEWSIPGGTGNIIQTDSVKGDIAFYVQQVRNNPTFVCPSELPTQ